jgi:hypothetical protein
VWSRIIVEWPGGVTQKPALLPIKHKPEFRPQYYQKDKKMKKKKVE